MRTIPAGEFKAKCLKIMDEVAATGEPVLVTKRGKPVVSVRVPESVPGHKPEDDSIFGFMRGLAAIPGEPDGLVASEFTDEEWERMAREKWERLEREDSR